MIANLTASQFALTALSIFFLGMSKGGFPIGPIALPLLILFWPQHDDSTKQVVAFMLPMLCMMDICAMLLYRRHVQWRLILPLFPGALLGIGLAALLFIPASGAFAAASDRYLKAAVGIIGLGFIAWQLWRQRFLADLSTTVAPPPPHWYTPLLFGVTAGATSTLAHAAGPVAQMYYLPQRLEKMAFAATIAAFFFFLNLLKLVPFVWFQRITLTELQLGACVLPFIPLGVGAGYLLVRRIHNRAYVYFIYTVLFAASLTLIGKAI